MKPVSVSVMVKLVLVVEGVPTGMEIIPPSDRVPPPGAPDQLLLPSSPWNWYAEPAATSSAFNKVRSVVPKVCDDAPVGGGTGIGVPFATMVISIDSPRAARFAAGNIARPHATPIKRLQRLNDAALLIPFFIPFLLSSRC